MVDPPEEGKRGDPPAEARDTRGAILASARRRFLDRGFAAVTLRAVAEGAGVDVALVSYYFGAKQDLFLAALAPAGIPGRRTDAVLATTERASWAHQLLDGVMEVWETESEDSSALRAILDASTNHPEILEQITRSIDVVRERLTAEVGGPDAELRATAYIVHIVGLVYTRYLLRVEPVASMPRAEVVQLLLPSIAAALGGGGAPEAGCGRGSGAVPSAATDPHGAASPGAALQGPPSRVSRSWGEPAPLCGDGPSERGIQR